MMTRTTCRRLFAPALVVGLCLAPFAGVGNGGLVYVPSSTPSDPDEGGTALHWAVRLGAMDVVEALVAAGVDPDARDADGETALHWLARRDEGGLWLAGADRAAVLGRSDAAAAVAALVGLGADVQAATTFGRTPLHEAARTDASGMVSALLAAGVPVGATDVAGMTALHRAAEADAAGAVSLLLGAGAAVDVPDDAGATALHWAARGDAAGAVSALLDAGARVDATDVAGMTAVHWAARGDAAGVVSALVEAGAPVDAVDDEGSTALYLAARDDAPGAVSALVEAGARVDATVGGVTALDAALLARSPRAVSALAAAGADVRRRMPPWDATPLHQAAYHSMAEGAGALLEAGADVNARDNEGETPLHWLVRGMTELRTQGNSMEALQTMQVLTAHGADTGAKNDAGETPLGLGHRLNQERLLPLTW